MVDRDELAQQKRLGWTIIYFATGIAGFVTAVAFLLAGVSG